MTVAFIGTGNMGAALAVAVRRALPTAELLLANRTPEKAQILAEEIGACVTDNCTAAQRADFLFLGVKPQMLADMAKEICNDVAARGGDVVLVSMAAGVDTARLSALFGADTPIVRIMPNLPVRIGQGMTLWCDNGVPTERQKADFRQLMSASGQLGELTERLIDAGSAISGCGPAFVSLFVEALADGGVACGLSRAQATEFAVQTLLGTAAVLSESSVHPAALKDAVCSPGGSTIAGVRALEDGAFRSTVMRAVDAAYLRTRELGT